MEPAHILAAIILGLALVGYIACLVRYYWATLILTAAILAYLSQEIPIVTLTIAYWSAAALMIAIALIVALIIKTRNKVRRPVRAAKPLTNSGRSVVIDGTNVMYWDGETTQLETLRSVVNYLRQRDINPIVFLDASSRHHLKNKSLTEKGFARALALPQKQVMVCPAGTEADVFILKFAKTEALPILSNDRFGDRSNLAKGIKIVKGIITSGRPILDGL